MRCNMRDKKELWKRYSKEYRLAHKEERKAYDSTPERRRNQRLSCKKSEAKIKREVLAHYGNGALACVSCGFDDIRALSIDHINGGGTQHTEGLNRHGGAGFYRWLHKSGYPEGYQVLCMNCQFVKRVEQREYGVGAG